jgi:hypothetical protein
LEKVLVSDNTVKPKMKKRAPPAINVHHALPSSAALAHSPRTFTSHQPSDAYPEADSSHNKPLPATNDGESAPSPAILLQRARASATMGKSSPSIFRGSSPIGRPSVESTQSARLAAPKRRNSRLRRRSQPSDGKTTTRHRRTFSNPLRRSSGSSPPRASAAASTSASASVSASAATGTASASVAAAAAPAAGDDRPSTADSIEDAVDAYLDAPRLSQKIRHPEDGRTISFSEVGDPDGYAVFCCVGMGLTRYIMAFYDELALTLKLRLITPDRPGVGDSEAYPDGTSTPLAWPGEHFLFQSVYCLAFSLSLLPFVWLRVEFSDSTTIDPVWDDGVIAIRSC